MDEKITLKESCRITKRIWAYSGKLKIPCILAAIGSSCAPLYYAYVNSELYQQFLNLCTEATRKEAITSLKILLAVLIIGVLALAVCFMVIFQVNVKVGGKVKKAAYMHTMKMQESAVNSSYMGDSLARVTNDLNNALELIGYTLLGYDNPFSMIITITGTYIIILQRSMLLANISLALSVMNLLVLRYYIMPLQKKETTVRQASAEAGEVIVNGLSGLMESKIFGFSDLLRNSYIEKTNVIYKSSVSIIRKKSNIRITASIQSVVSSIGVMMIGLYLMRQGHLDIGTIIFIVNLQSAMSNAMGGLGDRIASVQRNLVSGKRFLEYMDSPEEIEREEKEIPNKNAAVAIAFNHVNFSYPGCDNLVLEDINLQIKTGENVALVGGSGGGKSTLLKLLLNLEHADSGEIQVFEHGIHDYSMETVRKLFSYVPQDCFLFDGTIKENILLGNANASQEDLERVIEQANLKEFIDSLKDGYDTEIGEHGSKISGGQKQRIAIARAMLKDAPIILLDEATSSLDSESEQIVKDALSKLTKNKTCITIAHRLSTIEESDVILVLEKGKIVESGNHNSLLQLNERYAQLYHMQFV